MEAEVKYEHALLGFIMHKRWRIARHLLMLIPLASTFYPSMNEAENVVSNFLRITNKTEFFKSIYEFQTLAFLLALVLIYFNLYVLIPRLLFKDKLLYYVLSCIALATVFFLATFFLSRWIYEDFLLEIPPPLVPHITVKGFVDGTLMPFIFLGSTAGYKIFKKWFADNNRMNELKNVQLKEELNQLKNQVNPHFLFNTLNNLNTLVLTNPEKASQVVLGLSDVLRYQIYDSTKEQVLLKNDIAMLNQFLMLEKIRREKFRYEISVDADLKGVLIPPLLFVNFVDNALKHGADSRDPYYLKLNFSLGNNQLLFCAENSKPSMVHSKEPGGVGLKNIRRRLDLLYGSNYTLTLVDEPNLYIVNLSIPL